VPRKDYIQSKNLTVILIKQSGNKYLYYKHISANSLQFKNYETTLLYQYLSPFLVLSQAKPRSNEDSKIHNMQAGQTYCTPDGELVECQFARENRSIW
jgi:hypothetical protein